MKLGNALAAYDQAVKRDGLAQVIAVYEAAALMAQAIEEHIVGEAMKAVQAGDAVAKPSGDGWYPEPVGHPDAGSTRSPRAGSAATWPYP